MCQLGIIAVRRTYIYAAMKTQTKTALLLLAIILVLILLFSGFVFHAVSTFSHDGFYKLLEVKALTTAKVKLKEMDECSLKPIETIRRQFFEGLPKQMEYTALVGDEIDMAELTAETGLPASFFAEILREGKARHKISERAYKGIKYSTGGQDYFVIASAENYMDMKQSVYMRNVILSAILVSVLISIFFAFYFSNSIFQPMRTMTGQVKQINLENLHLRLDNSKRNDELQELAQTFNEMLDRLETSFETQNNFISNASHELRTPLTAIIGEADVAMSKPRSTDEYVESLQVIVDEAEKLEAKTKALLFLAQTGFNGKVQKFDKVRMDQLLWDVKDTLTKINPKNKVHIDMELLPENPAKLKVKGNEQLLHLALSNIINNACKYSSHSVVKVSIGASDDQIFIVVKDTGIGIPAKDIARIYDPFFRGSNTKDFEGYGVGLPLAQNIIRLHGGTLHVSSIENEGTTVELTLPMGHYTLE